MKKCKIHKIISINLKVLKLKKQLSNQTVSFKKEVIFFKLWSFSDSVLGIMWHKFFYNDKSFSTHLLFGLILEQQIIAIINNQQQWIHIVTYLKNSLFSDVIVFEKIYWTICK